MFGPPTTSSSSAKDEDEVARPPRLEFRPFDASRRTDHLVDFWRMLLRMSVDAAVMPASASNIFAFIETCIYFATVHNLDEDSKNLDKEAKVKENEDHALRHAGWDEMRSKVHTLRASTSSSTVASAAEGALSESDRAYTMEGLYQSASQNAPSLSAINDGQMADLASGHANITVGNRTSISDPGATRRIDDDVDVDIDWLNDPFVGREERSDLIGIAYLAPATGTADVACEASLGLALLPHAQRKGFGSEIVRQLLELAFGQLEFHRVSVSVLGPGAYSLCRPPGTCPGSTTGKSAFQSGDGIDVQKEKSKRLSILEVTEAVLRMFIALGFTIEGTRRRSVPDSEDNGVWRDAYYLAMLDTEWVALQCLPQVAPRRTRWDEILARHQSETEALASTESRLKRSASTETLRPNNGAAINIDTAPSVGTSSAVSECDKGEEQERSAFVKCPSSSSASISISNPFRDPISVQDEPISRFSVSSESRSRSDDEDGDDDYDEVVHDTMHTSSLEKVARFLRAHPAPGPPPSEIGSNLDSEVEADFESCADPDDLGHFGDKRKGKAESVIERQKSPRLGVITARITERTSSLDSAGINAISSCNPETSQQVRKKRRLSDASSNTSSSHIPVSASDPRCTLPTGFGIKRTQLLSGGLGSGLALHYRDVFPDTRSPDIDVDVDSDVESTTTTSAWDVVSGGERSLSPTRSISSGTGSLSLQSASGSEGE